MANTYNVHFAGEVITGHEPAHVREKLGKLFAADAATLDKLFSGTPRLIKKNCDRATAEKYRAAMQRAGAIAVIEPPLDAEATSAADKIAALAAAPDTGRRPEEAHAPTEQPQPGSPPEPAADAALQLRPPQSAVLEDHERAEEQVRDIDTSALSVGDQGERLAPEAPPAPSAPDTTHLDIAEAGADIPNLPSNEAPLDPNTDNIDLAPEGTDFTDCAA
ncbi:MAG: hypothetical protein HKN19_16065, partial [Halioglobus sp.]|nr:hypothetical protein [Halioglobus sp.]